MKRLKLGKLYYEISKDNPPAIKINHGETLVVETEDAFSGQIRKEGDRRDAQAMPHGNPQSGPIYVQGAERGDTLSVYIVDIKPLIGQAATRTAGPGILADYLGKDVPHGTRICPIRDGKVWWSDKITIPYEPMIGTIGTAPEEKVTTGPAGPYGGNMDIKEVTIGNTLYLPVLVPGALLHLGDVHAAQGDGELCGTALEMPAECVITVDLIKNKTIFAPRIESPKELMTIATVRPMEVSVAKAYADMILWLENDYGFYRWDAYNLLTQVGRLSVGYFGIGTVAVKFPKQYLLGNK